MDLAELRALQDFTVRPALQAVAGVAEVASLGGFERQYQIVVDPDRLVGFGLTLTDITRSIRDANAEVGARVLELAGREYVLRGRGYVKELADLEQSVVTVGAGGTPVRLGDVASVRFGPEIRRGAADFNGTGEAVGGIVVMRIGSNALEVIEAVKREIATLRLPEGVQLLPTYDRSDLILGSIDTLKDTLDSAGGHRHPHLPRVPVPRTLGAGGDVRPAALGAVLLHRYPVPGAVRRTSCRSAASRSRSASSRTRRSC